jgi:hypothetical protein
MPLPWHFLGCLWGARGLGAVAEWAPCTLLVTIAAGMAEVVTLSSDGGAMQPTVVLPRLKCRAARQLGDRVGHTNGSLSETRTLGRCPYGLCFSR